MNSGPITKAEFEQMLTKQITEAMSAARNQTLDFVENALGTLTTFDMFASKSEFVRVKDVQQIISSLRDIK